MIKVEKTGNDVAISEVIGSTYDLIYEFHVALKAIYRRAAGKKLTKKGHAGFRRKVPGIVLQDSLLNS